MNLFGSDCPPGRAWRNAQQARAHDAARKAPPRWRRPPPKGEASRKRSDFSVFCANDRDRDGQARSRHACPACGKPPPARQTRLAPAPQETPAQPPSRVLRGRQRQPWNDPGMTLEWPWNGPQCPRNRPDSKTGRRGTGRRAGSQTGSRNIAAATAVGTKADRNSLPAEILPSGKAFLRMAYPAGLGALAITVRPPPVTAPATNM